MKNAITICGTICILGTLLALSLLTGRDLSFWAWGLGGGVSVALAVLVHASKPVRLNFLLIVFSVLLALFIVNAFLVISKWDDPYVAQLRERMKAAKTLGVPFDQRSADEVIRDYAEKGINITYPVLPQMIVKGGSSLLPVSTVSNSRMLLGNEGGTWAAGRSDRFGFNNPDTVWDNPADALVVGDSFVQGVAVGEGRDVCALLRKEGISAVSLGMAGNGPLLELASIREYVSFSHPKIVYWLFYEGNDFRNLQYERQNSILMSYLDDPTFSQGLIGRQSEVDTLYSRIMQSTGNNSEYGPLEYILLRRLRKMLGLAFYKEDLPAIDDELNWTIFGKTILAAREEVSRLGGEFVFVYLPEYSRFVSPQPSSFIDRREEILAFLKKHGIRVLDMTNAFKDSGVPLVYFPLRMHGHYNEAGYDKLAEEMSKFISLPTP